MKTKLFFFVFLTMLISCASSDDIENPTPPINPDTIYFPPIDNSTWETISLTDLGWNENSLQPLLNFVEEKDSKAFIILKNGRIAIEWYADDFSETQNWYWASAGKTLTSVTVGIAEQEGHLELNNRTNSYLGDGWTNMTQERENAVTVLNQLSMTSGLNDLIFDCTDPICLFYKADASTRWAYHNAPYTLLQDVIGNGTGETFENYFNSVLRDKIGMDGAWFGTNNYNNVYFSTARSMARFGILMMNKGTWESDEILNQAYYSAMTNPSQSINKSYGYLWWLNGKQSFMLPGSQEVFNGTLIPNAPSDLIAGLGKNDQKLYVVPSQDLVIIRMGDVASDDALVPITFDNELWEKINAVIN
ncbi:MAG: serine hydrolase [Urechidicola sp.]|nr:serine hydrolase [Urechidicola sp.]